MSFSATKDPNSDLDYSINWTDWLTGSETIATSTWAVTPPAGITIHGTGIDSTHKITTIWLAGSASAPSVIYLATNRIVTNSTPPRTEDRSIRFTIEQR